MKDYDYIVIIDCVLSPPEHKGELVTLSVTKNNLIELVHNIAGAFVHQVQSCFLIGFGEVVSIGELVETFPVYPDNDPTVGQQSQFLLKLPCVLELTFGDHGAVRDLPCQLGAVAE